MEVRRTKAALWSLVMPLLLAVFGLSLSGCAWERPEDPVVVTGAEVPRLVGVPPSEVIAYRWLNDRWEQLPVQVDERAMIDLGSVYNQAPNGFRVLTYTDPGTFAGPDPNAALDDNDEIALMGVDAGFKANAGSRPPNVVAGSGEEIRIHDPVGSPVDLYVYLYRQTGNLPQDAGRSYVDYDFNLLSGSYKTTYKLQDGPNPEDSTVETAYYSRHFADRWASDGLRIKAPGASGVDILDRHKNLFAPGTCGRSEDTFDDAEGAFIVNKSGPIRAIRSYIGANSGPLTGRQHIFYERSEEITTFLRVHAIPGVMDFFDYSPAATGMTYRSDVDRDGITIDGQPDSVDPGRIRWETVDGSQGGLSIVHDVDSDIAGLDWTSYYFDDSTPASSGSEKQCTGDNAAYGSSGVYVNQSIPNTDPRMTPFNSLTDRRTIFYERPGQANGVKRKEQLDRPIEIAVAPAD